LVFDFHLFDNHDIQRPIFIVHGEDLGEQRLKPSTMEIYEKFITVTSIYLLSEIENDK